MPKDVTKIPDFIQTLPNFNKYSKPVISIDSYDQSIYTTSLLASFGRYIEKKNQQLGFYFIPFAKWAWKNNTENTKLEGTDYNLSDVVLRDNNNQPIWFKNGDWGCLALDPTHPAVRQFVIYNLKEAKAIGAKFIKIDFLTAGALESTRRYDPNIRTGIQAYNYGMKMLKTLADSIMGKDIFITEAISLCSQASTRIPVLYQLMFIRTCVMMSLVFRTMAVPKVRWLMHRICGGYRVRFGRTPTWMLPL